VAEVNGVFRSVSGEKFISTSHEKWNSIFAPDVAFRAGIGEHRFNCRLHRGADGCLRDLVRALRDMIGLFLAFSGIGSDAAQHHIVTNIMVFEFHLI
jgi:hypothetical protein